METLPDDIRAQIEFDMQRLDGLQRARRRIVAALGRRECVARIFLFRAERDAVAATVKLWRRQMVQHGFDAALLCSQCRLSY